MFKYKVNRSTRVFNYDSRVFMIKRILLYSLFISTSALAGLVKVQVNGFDVEYELSGKGKHTILLEAGGSGGLSDWDQVFESLIQHAKVIRYSRIDNGGSAQIKKNYSSEEYAAEAVLLLKALKIEEPEML